MQTVSQLWKDAHKQAFLNESFVEVSLDIADPESVKGAAATDNGAVYISNTPEIVSGVSKDINPYTTLEQNMWLLDGSRKHIPIVGYSTGEYVGDTLSDESGVFVGKTPTITISFSRVYEKLIPGITITWGTVGNDFATQFIVTAYNGDTIIATKEIMDNKSVVSIVALDIINYDRITIQVLKWCLPNRRVRVDEIFVGWHKVYSKADLFGYSHSQSVDPVSTSLPKMEIKFSIDNIDNFYNPYNPNGLSKYLMERQEVKARYGLKLHNNTIEWIKSGTFYLSEWYATQNGMTADFTARDLLEFMSDNYKDRVTKISDRSLYDLAVQVLQAANLPLNTDGSVRWVVDDSLKGIYTKAPLPDDTMANCLQLIANAGKCVLYPDRDGVLHIEPIHTSVTDYKVNSFNSYAKPELTFSKMIKDVAVKVYSYTISEKGVESSYNEITIGIGDVGDTITIDNPLLTSETDARKIGEWVGGYLKNRMTVKANVRADVRLDALDIVTNEHDFGANQVRMTNVDFKFNGAFKGTSEGRVI